MALLRRELCRQVRGPEVTHADRCTLVFDTDAKNLYVEREVAHLDVSIDGSLEIRTATMDIADYFQQGGQTAGHRELWRLLRTIFKEDDNPEDMNDVSRSAGSGSISSLGSPHIMAGDPMAKNLHGRAAEHES
jgi:hypothetical protein